MNSINQILIVDDNIKLRKKLIEISNSVLPTNWKIIEADNLENSIIQLEQNKIDILLCDLYLNSGISKTNKMKVIPEGIRVVRHAQLKNPSSVSLIVTSFPSIILENQHFIKYNEYGVDLYLDRASNYSKFIFDLKHCLHKISQPKIHFNDSKNTRYELDISENYSLYIVLFCMKNHNKFKKLLGELFYWGSFKKAIDSRILIISDNEDEYLSYLQDTNIISDITSFPTLLIGKTHEMLPHIKLNSTSLNMILKEDSLSCFLNVILSFLDIEPFFKIRERMRYKSFWQWLNNNAIEGYSHDTNSFLYSEERPQQNQNVIQIIETMNNDNNQSTYNMQSAKIGGGFSAQGGTTIGDSFTDNSINIYHSQDIAKLISSLQEIAQKFPKHEKEDALDEIDVLKAELTSTDSKDPVRIGRRLRRLVQTATLALTIGGSAITGAVDLSTQVKDFTVNVEQIANILGIELVQ